MSKPLIQPRTLKGFRDFLPEAMIPRERMMEIAKILISELKYDPDHMLMIGDTIHDHEVALSIGVDCILVDHGHVSKERLVSTGRVVHSGIESIMKIVLTSKN